MSGKAVERSLARRPHTLATQLLGATPELLLKRSVPRSLERGHERAERALLVDLELGAAALELEHAIERFADALLIGVLTGEDRATQREPLVALLRRELDAAARRRGGSSARASSSGRR